MVRYPKALVKKLGTKELHALFSSGVKRHKKWHHTTTPEERVDAYIRRDQAAFKISDCARSCATKKEIVLSILQARNDIRIDPDGCCYKTSTTFHADMASQTGDR